MRLRRVSDWSPVIIVAILYNSQLHLSLILATALSAGNLLADLIFKQCGYIKVSLIRHTDQASSRWQRIFKCLALWSLHNSHSQLHIMCRHHGNPLNANVAIAQLYCRSFFEPYLSFPIMHILQVWPKYLDVCFLLTYSITLILSYTIADSFVGRWLEVITEGGSCLLIVVCTRALFLRSMVSAKRIW